MEKQVTKKSSDSMKNFANAAEELGLAMELIINPDDGEVDAILIGIPDFINNIELKTLYKTKEVH